MIWKELTSDDYRMMGWGDPEPMGFCSCCGDRYQLYTTGDQTPYICETCARMGTLGRLLRATLVLLTTSHIRASADLEILNPPEDNYDPFKYVDPIGYVKPVYINFLTFSDRVFPVGGLITDEIDDAISESKRNLEEAWADEFPPDPLAGMDGCQNCGRPFIDECTCVSRNTNYDPFAE